jgi:hypothetical protein
LNSGRFRVWSHPDRSRFSGEGRDLPHHEITGTEIPQSAELRRLSG